MRALSAVLALMVCLVVGVEAVAIDVDMDPVPRFPLRKGDTLTFLITLSGAEADCKGRVSFEKLPDGLAAEPAKADFELAAGASKQLVFVLRCTAWGGEDDVRPVVTVAGGEAVNFPERLKTTIVRTRKMLDKKPIRADGLLAYYSCGDFSKTEYHHFDRCAGNQRFWEEGIWYHDGGVKGRAVFGMNAMPYPRHRWSKFAFEPLNNLYYKRGTVTFWIRRSRRLAEIPYSASFKGDPKSSWKIGPTAMRGYQGEGLMGYIWSPQTIYTRWYLKGPRPWKPFQPSSDSFLSLRRYKAVKGVTTGFLEATYLAMRGKRYHVRAPYEWDEAWRHLAVLWDTEQGRLELYLDGKKVSGPLHLDGKRTTDKSWRGAPWHVATFCNAAMSIVCVGAEGGRGATDRDEYYIFNRALAVEEIRKNMADSVGKVVTPVIVPEGGKFAESVVAEVRSLWADPAHRFTLDGSEPTESSPALKGKIELMKTTTLKVRSFLKGFAPSDVVSAGFERLGPDRTAPAVTLASAVNDPRSVLVAFTEPVEKSSAETAGNYAVDGRAVTAAGLEPDGRTVRLTVSGPLAAGARKLAVKGVRDRAKAGNVMAASETAFELKLLPGLTGYYSFDVLPGPAVKDLSPSRIDGLAWDDLHPGIKLAPGPAGKGKAVRLDGVDDLVDVTDYLDARKLRVNPKSPHNVDQGTLAIWLRGDPGGVGYKKHIIAKTYAYEIWSTNGNLQHTKNIKVVDGKWHHLVVTYAGRVKNGLKFYLDGKLVHTETGRFLKHHMMGVGLGVGGGGYGQPMFFKGALDEFMIFNRILTPEEVAKLHQTGAL